MAANNRSSWSPITSKSLITSPPSAIAQVPAASSARDTGHGRIETRTLKAAHVSRLDFPGSRQAIKITRRREDAITGRISRRTVYAVTSLTSADATAQDLARLVRGHWSIETHHHECPRRDVQRRYRDQP